MNLIIESGATKTEWMVIEHNEILFHESVKGINPNYLSDNEISIILSKIAQQIPCKKTISNITHYGAGCLREENQHRVKAILHGLFPEIENIKVHSDLLAACRACSPKQGGVVGILGTGAVVCQYNGKKIEYVAPSLGFMLGDEGSGAYLGKQFITKYLLHQFSDKITQTFEETFQVNAATVIRTIYKDGEARSFFASLSPFIHSHINEPEILDLVKQSFHQFFKIQNVYFPNEKIWHFAGSVAYYYLDILREVASAYGIEVGVVVKAPLLELAISN